MTAGDETSISQAYGRIKAHAEEVGGAGLNTDVYVYEVIDGDRDYVDNFYTYTDSGDGSMVLLPGTYDIRMWTGHQNKWFEGLVVTAGDETSISQAYGRITVHVDTSVSIHVKIYEADGNFVDDFWTSTSTGDGSMVLLPDAYSVKVLTDPVAWYRGIEVAPGQTSRIPIPGNQPPTANAGPDQTVTDTNGNGQENVTLDGSGSSDPDGSITSYVWIENGVQIATGETPTVSLAIGEHTITLMVTDNDGATDTDTVIITVQSLTPPPPARVVRPAFLGPEPLHYEFMQGGELILTYRLLDSEGNPLPDTEVELTATCVFTDRNGMFRVVVDESELASYGTPVVHTTDTYIFRPITGVTGYVLENPPVLMVIVLPREWETKWTFGAGYSGTVALFKAKKDFGYVISWDQDGELTFGRTFEQGAGLSASIGAKVSLTSKLKRGAGLSGDALLMHMQEDEYRFPDITSDTNEQLAFAGLLLASVAESTVYLNPVSSLSQPVLGPIFNAVGKLILPWDDYRTQYGAKGGIKMKAEGVADLRGSVVQQFSSLGPLTWLISSSGGTGVELKRAILVGRYEQPSDDLVTYELSDEVEVDGYADLPFGLADIPLDDIIGGRVALVLKGGQIQKIIYEILSRDGDHDVVNQFSVSKGHDVNANGVDDLIDILESSTLMFTLTVVNDIIMLRSATVIFPGVLTLLAELEQVTSDLEVPVSYQTICYRDLGDVDLDPGLLLGLVVNAGLGAHVKLQKELEWMKAEGIWYEGKKYPAATYTYDTNLLGDTKTLDEMYQDAIDMLQGSISDGVNYIVRDVVPGIPWEMCGTATLIGGPIAGGACVGFFAGAIIGTDTIELLSWNSKDVESRNGGLEFLSQPQAPDEPVCWEGILAVGGFHALFPQGLKLQVPAELTMTYTDDVLPPGCDEKDFDIFGWDDVNGRWFALGAHCDPSTNTLSAKITLFTTYVVGLDVPPGRPWGLQADAGEDSITLTWNADAEADLSGFFVYRGTAPGGPYDLLTSEPVTSLTYLDYPVEGGTWFYVVSSVDTAGHESELSEERAVVVGLDCNNVTEDLEPLGWHMITLPGDLCGTCAAGGFGDLVCALGDGLDPCYIFHYDPMGGGYVMAPPAENIPYHAGMGFWVRTYEDNAAIDADVQVATEAVGIPLGKGWNQVGNPFAFAIAANALRVRCGDTELLLADAQAQGWVSAYLFGYDTGSGGYVMIDPASGCLQPWNGYWMRSYRDDCVLIVPPTECSSSAPAGTPMSVKELHARGLETPPQPPTLKLMSEAVVEGLTVRNVPNPIHSEHTTTFKVEGKGAELIQALRIDIYDLSGHKVFTQDINAKELEWHTDNEAGELLANGVYLYQVWVKIADTWYPTGVHKLAVVR